MKIKMKIKDFFINNQDKIVLASPFIVIVGILIYATFVCWPLTSKTNDNLEPLITVEQDFDNSLIQLKNDTGLKFVHADEVKKEEITEHAEYNKENPIFLINVPFGQNIRYLRNRIENDNIRIYYNNKNEELEDNEVVRSGLRIVAKNGSIVTDTIIVIVTGDIESTGRKTRNEKIIIEKIVNNQGDYKNYELLSCDINNDNKLNEADITAFKKAF